MSETKHTSENIPYWTYNRDGRFRPVEEVFAGIDARSARRAAEAQARNGKIKRHIAGAALTTMVLTHPAGQEAIDTVAGKTVETVQAAGERLDNWFNGPNAQNSDQGLPENPGDMVVKVTPDQPSK